MSTGRECRMNGEVLKRVRISLRAPRGPLDSTNKAQGRTSMAPGRKSSPWWCTWSLQSSPPWPPESPSFSDPADMITHHLKAVTVQKQDCAFLFLRQLLFFLKEHPKLIRQNYRCVEKWASLVTPRSPCDPCLIQTWFIARSGPNSEDRKIYLHVIKVSPSCKSTAMNQKHIYCNQLANEQVWCLTGIKLCK